MGQKPKTSTGANLVRNSLEGRRNRDRAAQPSRDRKPCSMFCKPLEVSVTSRCPGADQNVSGGRTAEAVLPKGRSAIGSATILAGIVFRIDILDVPRSGAVELDHRVFVGE